MFNSRNSFRLLLLLLILSAPIWWSSIVSFLTPRQVDIQKNYRPSASRSFVMKDAVLYQYIDGRQQWLVKAKQIRSTTIDGDFYLKKLNAVLYENSGEEEISFRGNEGLYEKEKEVFNLTGEAVVFLKHSGWILKSEKLSYDIKNHEVNSTTEVYVEAKDIKIKGRGLQYNMKSGFLRIDGRVGCDVS